MEGLLPRDPADRSEAVIYVVLPAFNEELTLGPLFDALAEHLDEVRLQYRIIVVNDGSTDGTGRIIRDAAARLSIVPVEHAQNQGLAEALKSGLLEAVRQAGNRDIIITMDSDNTHTPGLIMRMVRMIREGHDVVIASRYRRGARVIGVPFPRRVLSYGASVVFRALFPIKEVKDYTSGYRAYRAEIIKKMFDVYGDQFIDEPGFSCMVDILLKMRRFPVIIGEVPLILRYDRKASASKMHVARTVRQTLRLIAKRWLSRT
jgi:dolichol-phosphate mannosyltransferase